VKQKQIEKGKIKKQEKENMNNQFRLKGFVWRWGVFSSFLLLATAWALAAQAQPTIPAFDGADYDVLDPSAITKYVQPLVIPPVMPESTDPKADYNIATRQFKQQILPGGVWNTVNGREDDYPATTVWSYGKAEDDYDLNYTAPMPLSDPNATTFNYPALTVEAKQDQRTRVRWINELFDPSDHHYLPHLLPVDRTLHWANPEQLDCKDGTGAHTDCKPAPSNGSILQEAYDGPVPIVTHVHGAHVNPESDGYPEAWWLPNASNIPAGYASKGALYDQWDRSNTWPGSAIFTYFNTQRAATIWYHDHGLGITRVNVYAGPAGFWLIRGQEVNEPDLASGVLPGPPPALGEDPNFNAAVRSKIREVPIVIQGRTFKPDGELFFPDNRAYFEGLNVAGGASPTLDIAFIPDTAVGGGVSDVAPIWNPEFFGNAMVVNGTTWPVYHVARSKYRLRLLNGCNARTLTLKMVTGASLDAEIADFNANGRITTLADSALHFWQIGADGGLLPLSAVELSRLKMMPAERADVVVDFSDLPEEINEIYLINEGPDEPFGGGDAPGDFDAADPNTTGQIMKFVVDQEMNEASTDATASEPENLQFTDVTPLAPTKTRQVSLNELESETVFVVVNGEDYVLDTNGNVSECDPSTFTPEVDGDECVPFGPTEAKVGILAPDPFSPDGFVGIPLMWTDMTGASTMLKVFNTDGIGRGKDVVVPVTEMPNINDTEMWEIWNFTADAHPIHLHLVEFQVVEREELIPDDNGTGFKLSGVVTPREDWETGYKDTVIAYPEQATRIRARFDVAGLYVWHCHIIDHEDNEMMRPYAVVPDLNQDGCVDRKDQKALIQDIVMGGGNYDLNGDGTEDYQDAVRLTLFFTNKGGAVCR